MKQLLLLALMAALLGGCNQMNTEQQECVKVTGKERIASGESSYYLVFTDKGEFTIKDEMLRGNYNSSKWYGMLEEDSCYSFKTGGYRNGFWSMYKNIHTKPEKVSCK